MKPQNNIDQNQFVYKVLTMDQWEQFQKDKVFTGSQLDQKDGFIHLSLIDQVKPVIKRYYLEKLPVIVLKFKAIEMGNKLKYEQSTHQEYFPHLYSSSLYLEKLINSEIIDQI